MPSLPSIIFQHTAENPVSTKPSLSHLPWNDARSGARALRLASLRSTWTNYTLNKGLREAVSDAPLGANISNVHWFNSITTKCSCPAQFISLSQEIESRLFDRSPGIPYRNSTVPQEFATVIQRYLGNSLPLFNHTTEICYRCTTVATVHVLSCWQKHRFFRAFPYSAPTQLYHTYKWM